MTLLVAVSYGFISGDRFYAIGCSQDPVAMPWISELHQFLPWVQAALVTDVSESFQEKRTFDSYMLRYSPRPRRIYYVVRSCPFHLLFLHKDPRWHCDSCPWRCRWNTAEYLAPGLSDVALAAHHSALHLFLVMCVVRRAVLLVGFLRLGS